MSDENKPENGLIARMIAAQIGTPSESNLIEEHMKEYFTRWPKYKERLTELEWYHLFLDFLDKVNIPAASLPPDSLKEGEIAPGVRTIILSAFKWAIENNLQKVGPWWGKDTSILAYTDEGILEEFFISPIPDKMMEEQSAKERQVELAEAKAAISVKTKELDYVIAERDKYMNALKEIASGTILPMLIAQHALK